MEEDEGYLEEVIVGSERIIGKHRVTKDEIVRFASEWDPQPFHIDEEAARNSVFGELTASSCHTYSLSSLIFHRSEVKLRTVAMLGMDECRFPTPMRPADEITLAQQILEKRRSKSRPHLGIVKSRTTMTNASGELIMVMVSNFMVAARA